MTACVRWKWKWYRNVIYKCDMFCKYVYQHLTPTSSPMSPPTKIVCTRCYIQWWFTIVHLSRCGTHSKSDAHRHYQLCWGFDRKQKNKSIPFNWKRYSTTSWILYRINDWRQPYQQQPPQCASTQPLPLPGLSLPLSTAQQPLTEIYKSYNIHFSNRSLSRWRYLITCKHLTSIWIHIHSLSLPVPHSLSLTLSLSSFAEHSFRFGTKCNEQTNSRQNSPIDGPTYRPFDIKCNIMLVASAVCCRTKT